MSEEIAEFTAYMVDPDTNRKVAAALLDECMAEIQYAAAMTVISVIMREET